MTAEDRDSANSRSESGKSTSIGTENCPERFSGNRTQELERLKGRTDDETLTRREALVSPAQPVQASTPAAPTTPIPVPWKESTEAPEWPLPVPWGAAPARLRPAL